MAGTNQFSYPCRFGTRGHYRDFENDFAVGENKKNKRGREDGDVYCSARAVVAPAWRGRLRGLQVQALGRPFNLTGGAQLGKRG